VDPVTKKVFTDFSKLVAIKTSGRVYLWDTVEQLNVKAKNMRDLVSDEEFTKADLIILQDPMNLDSRNISTFKNLQDGQESKNEGASVAKSDKSDKDSEKIAKAKEAIAKLRAKDKAIAQADGKPHIPPETSTPSARKNLPYNAAVYNTGKSAASFTSTALDVVTSAERAVISEEDYMLVTKRVKIKGYASIQTNFGNLNIELYTDYAPKAVYNFVKLSQQGYYDGTIFHRSVRNFMIQGGDPTGTGRGGESYWKKEFPDEFNSPYKHDARGILSMANKGRNTNTSQFFITYRPVPHLDRKHTVFGKVVGGLEVLDKMEEVPTDTDEKPEKDIKINKILIYVDPFDEWQKKRKAREIEEEEEQEEAKKLKEDDVMTWTGKRLDTSAKPGRLIASSKGSSAGNNGLIVDTLQEPESVKKKPKASGFGNFDGW